MGFPGKSVSDFLRSHQLSTVADCVCLGRNLLQVNLRDCSCWLARSIRAAWKINCRPGHHHMLSAAAGVQPRDISSSGRVSNVMHPAFACASRTPAHADSLSTLPNRICTWALCLLSVWVVCHSLPLKGSSRCSTPVGHHMESQYYNGNLETKAILKGSF